MSSDSEKNLAKVEYDSKVQEVDPEAPISGSADYDEYLAVAQNFDDARQLALTRKMDFIIIPPLLLIYLLSYIDRSNVGNIKLFGIEADLGLSPTDWNIGLSLLFITFSMGGWICNALIKRLGPKNVLAGTFLGCGLSVVGLGLSSTRPAWFAMRLMLGLFEGGIWPSGVFVLTTWYTPSQLGFRLSVFYLGGALSGAFSGLLAFGIGQLDRVMGYRGWRWILLIEGVFSVLVAVAAWFWITEDPAHSKRFTAEERQYIVLRARYTYGSSRSGSKDDFTWRDFMLAIKSWHVWVLGFADFAFCVAIYGFTLTLPTIIANMGFSAASAQALSAPPYIFAAMCLLPCGYFSDKFKTRALAVMIPSSVAFVGLIICVTTAVYPNLVPLTYIGVTLAAGGMYCLAPAIATWISLNHAGQAKRAAAIAIGVFCTQLGGIMGSNIFLAAEKPRYPTGFGLSLGLLFVGCIILPAIYWVAVGRINAKRSAMLEEDINAKYTPEELTAMGDLSPYYRYER